MAGDTAAGRLLILRDVTEEKALARMRDDLTHTMVHDLRNPLGSISGALEILKLFLEKPEPLELVDIAQKSSQRMTDLVTSILDVSRLESGQMPLRPKTVDFCGLLQETFQVQAVLAAEKGLTLAQQTPADLPPAWIDQSLVGRVLQNLVGNAIKFTPAGGTIRVSARLAPDLLPPSLTNYKRRLVGGKRNRPVGVFWIGVQLL